MRVPSKDLGAVLACIVAAVLILSIIGCGKSQESEKSRSGAAPETPLAEATPADTASGSGVPEQGEEASAVTAQLNCFENGVKKTKDVPYLPEGRKVATLETTKGVVKIELWEDKAPNTIVNFVSLANAGRYDGVDFHRVIAGFMAQTGDVEKRGGYGGPGYTIPAEFDASLKHVRGVVSMARSSAPDSGGSQFFIMLDASPRLDGQYAAFGKVIEGMEVVDAIKKGDSAQNGAVENPDKIVKLRVAVVPSE